MEKFLIATLLIFFISCKVVKTPAKYNNQKNNQVLENVYRFSVSFISVGSGIDKESKQKFLDFINEYALNRNIKIFTEIFKWGREGEIDYCLNLSQLKPEEQIKIIAEIKELLKNSKLVRYKENTVCNSRQN